MGRTTDESEVSQYLVELVVPDLRSLFLPIEIPDHLDTQSLAGGARNHPLWHPGKLLEVILALQECC